MADNDVVKENAPILDLGLEESKFMGGLKTAEDFLSGASVNSNPNELENIENEEEEIIPEKETKKSTTKKIAPKIEIPKPEEVINSLLEEKEDEEEIIPEKQSVIQKVANKDKEAIISSEEEADGNQFEILSKELYKANVFSVGEGEEEKIAKTPEEFLELFNEEKQKGATQWLEGFLGRFGEDKQQLFEAIFVNGVDPKEYIPVYNQIENLENLDLTSEENQEAVVRAYYTKAGWDSDKIDAKIAKLKGYADLEDEAKTTHPQLVKQEKQSLEAIKASKVEEQRVQADIDSKYKDSIIRLLQEKLKTKDFDGIPINQKVADEAYDFMYTKKWKLANGELLTDFDKFILESKKPENVSSRLKIALLAKTNFDFSKIEKKAISKESNQLFSGFAQKEAKKSNTKNLAPDNTSWEKI